MLVNGLPPEAATFRVDGQQWTPVHELLALNTELTEHLVRLQAGEKAPVLKEPLRVVRPGEKQSQKSNGRDRVITDPAEIAAFFG